MICPACGYENFHPNATNCDLCHAVLKPDAPGAAAKQDAEDLAQELAEPPAGKPAAAAAKKGAKPKKAPAKQPARPGEEAGPGLDPILFLLALPVTFPVAAWALAGRRHPNAVAPAAWLLSGLAVTLLAVGFSLGSGAATSWFVLACLSLLADACGSVLLFRRGDGALGGPGLLITVAAGCVLVVVPLVGGDITQLEGHAGLILSLDVSGDGRRAVTGSEDATAIVWDMTSGQRLAQLTGHREGVSCARIDGTGAAAITGGWDGQLKVWTVAPLAEQLTLKSPGGGITSADISPDGQLVAFGSVRGEVEVHLRSGERASRPRGHDKAVEALTFSPDAKLLATGGADGSLSVWTPQTGAAGPRFTGHGKAIRALVFSADSRQLYSAGLDGGVKVWDVSAGGDATATLPGKSTDAPVRGLALHPGGRWLLGVDTARNLIAWDLQAKRIAGSKQLEPGSYPPAAVAWAGPTRCLVALDRVIQVESASALGLPE